MIYEFNEPWECEEIYISPEAETFGIHKTAPPTIKIYHQRAGIPPIQIRAGRPQHILVQLEWCKRITACVNACAGMTTEELEQIGTGGIKAMMGVE